MRMTSDHSRTPPEPRAHATEAPDDGGPRDQDREDEIPDLPLDEPPPVPLDDPPPPVTPGPYVAQEEKLCT
jgi:hypothetical protein